MNLWPDNLTNTKNPFDVLHRQSVAFMGNFNTLNSQVMADEGEKSAKLAIFSVVILEISNAFDYPCKVHFDDATKRCVTEAELIGELARVFNSQKVKMIIADSLK